MENLIARLRERWRDVGVKPNPGATVEELTAFEAFHQVKLPADLRQFLSAVNGMAFSELDGLARLRPVEEYFRILVRLPGPLILSADLHDPERYFCFGDYNIEGSLWGIRLSDDPASAAPVRVFWIGSGGGQVVAGSFRDFLARYLDEEPESMC